MKEPTQEQCRNRQTWNDGGFKCIAFYWPQMGGYSAKAVAQVNTEEEDSSCVIVFVWHDGEFPFTEDDRVDGNGKAKSPAKLHICDFGDWLQTMELLSQFQGSAVGESKD